MRPEFMIERNGKAFCLYAGLLDEAHQQGLKQIRTTLMQVPADDNGNVAICQCEVVTERGTFTGLGDAAPVNVARAMQTCLIRMAETRAKARALRDAVNVGVVAIEELDSDGQAEAEGRGHGSPMRVAEGGGRATTPVSGRIGAPRAASPAAAPAAARPARAEAPAPQPAVESAPAAPSAPKSPPANAPAIAPVNGGAPANAPAAPSGAPARPVNPPQDRARRPVRSGFEESPSEMPRPGTDPMTPAQRRMLEALSEQTGETRSLDGLSRREASQLIDELKSRIGQARAA